VIYALTPARRTSQVAGDLGFVVWSLLWSYAGRIVHGLVMGLAEPARRLQEAAAQFGTAATDAGNAVSQVPLAGDDLQGALGRLASVAADADAAGVQFATTVAHLALALGLAVALAPILALGIPYVLSRVRFVRRSGAAARFLDSEDDLDLFALRALSNQPLPRLAAISNDPVTAWRNGDREVITALAGLELRSVGLRPPRTRR